MNRAVRTLHFVVEPIMPPTCDISDSVQIKSAELPWGRDGLSTGVRVQYVRKHRQSGAYLGGGKASKESRWKVTGTRKHWIREELHESHGVVAGRIQRLSEWNRIMVGVPHEFQARSRAPNTSLHSTQSCDGRECRRVRKEGSRDSGCNKERRIRRSRGIGECPERANFVSSSDHALVQGTVQVRLFSLSDVGGLQHG